MSCHWHVLTFCADMPGTTAQVGTPGQGVLTWEESKSNLALFAVTSSPLILGNDPREGRIQERLVDLFSNP